MSDPGERNLWLSVKILFIGSVIAPIVGGLIFWLLSPFFVGIMDFIFLQRPHISFTSNVFGDDIFDALERILSISTISLIIGFVPGLSSSFYLLHMNSKKIKINYSNVLVVWAVPSFIVGVIVVSLLVYILTGEYFVSSYDGPPRFSIVLFLSGCMALLGAITGCLLWSLRRFLGLKELAG